MEYYSAFLLQLNMELCFSADTPPLSGIHIKQLPPHLYMALFPQIIITPLSGTFSSHLTLASAPRRAFLHPPLLVTFTLHLLPYYSTLMCHFPRASPRSISTHFNMVSFSLFLSHLYMTLFLFITHRQYYSPQLFRGGFSHHFLLSTGSFSHLSLAFLQIITF